MASNSYVIYTVVTAIALAALFTSYNIESLSEKETPLQLDLECGFT